MKYHSGFEKPDRVHTLWPSEVADKLWPGSSVVVVSVLMNSSVDVETGASYYSLRADPAPGTGGRAAEPISSSSSSRSLRAIANRVRTIDATATSPVPRLLI